MSLQTALNKLESINTKSRNIQRNINEKFNFSKTEIENAGDKAAKKIESKVRDMLYKNYVSSGLKSNTGKLSGAIRKSFVRFSFNKKPTLRYGMPPGMQPYKDGSDFYEVAESLNSGAVIVRKRSGKGIIGSKAKKSLKKKLLRRSEKSKGHMVAKGYNFGRIEKSTNKSISTGGGGEKVTVIKPRNYFNLTVAQEKKLGEELYEEMISILMSKIK